MCNLDLNQSGSGENYLTKTTTSSSKVKPKNIYRISSSNLDDIINTSRMVIMTDCTRSRPRKIILDTACDNSKINLYKNKESQLLFEIVFGNFNLSSKANGFKLHIIKNPSKMIVSKIFNTPFNAVYYEIKSNSRKISPDSGNNQSSSSNSSRNSNVSRFSSYHSLNSSIINQLPSSNHDEIGHLYSPQISKPNSTNCGTPSATPNLNEINKHTNDYFFNASYEMGHKSSIMMSIVFTFSIPEENRAEFEEFLFHYYVLLESVLNRLSHLIADNSHNIYNGRVVNCWKQSKKWLISLLPRHMANSDFQSRHLKLTNMSTNSINVKIIEEVLEYFDRSKRMRFLAQIITGILLVNQNSALKFFNESTRHCSEIFPYQQILQNLGVNIRNNTFNRIIVKGAIKDKFQEQSSSWKDKLSSSLKFYKNILHNSTSDHRSSCSELDMSIEPSANFAPLHNSRPSTNLVYKDVEILTEFISNLIRSTSTVSYQLHILPVDVIINETKIVQLNNNQSEIEIPLINDGLLLDKEILPQNYEVFSPNKIADHIFSSITPLQGLIEVQNHNETFRNQLLVESRQSKITYNDQIFHPDFLVIDIETSSVKIRDNQIFSSSWVEKVLQDIVSLTKLKDYSSVIGEIYLISALNDFSRKARVCKEYLSERQITSVDPWLMNQYGLNDSDLKLFSSIQH